jgi:HPt (histidine-containing phosphotransfer) domain-containing protein
VLLAKLHKFFADDEPLDNSSAEVEQVDITVQNVLDEKVITQLLADTGEEIFQRVLALFISETERRMTQVQQASLVDDIEQIEKEAHAIKSSAASVGAVKLGERAKALELACRQRQSHTVSELVAELEALSVASLDALKAHNLFMPNS